MKASCANCECCVKLSVPAECKNIPKDAYVCNLFWSIGESDCVEYMNDNTGMCEMYSPKMIHYKSENGYSGKLYGYSSMAIFDKDGNEVMHTGSRTPNTLEELKEVVDGYPAFIEMLRKIPLEDLKDAEDDEI